MKIGEVAEWLKAPLSKSGIPRKRDRGFESHPLRHEQGYISGFYVLRRDVREAEGARLEIVCAVNRGAEGSNPSLSAIIN